VAGKNVDALYGLFYPYPEKNNEAAPGSYTIVFPGCNIKCWFCDFPFLSVRFNGETSGWPGGAYRKLSPNEVIEKVRAKAGGEREGFKSGLMGLFGGEPTLHYEYILEAGRLCREAGCASKIHTSGYISEEIIGRIAKVVDVISVNVKGSGSPNVYQRMDANFDAVLHSIKVSSSTPHVRTVIQDIVGADVLPTSEDAARFARWLCDNVSSKVPVMIAPLVQSSDAFPDPWREGSRPPPGDEDPWTPFLRCKRVAETFAENGLTNVWVLEYTLGRQRVIHIPSLTPLSSSRLPDDGPFT
jgi:pyruvate-formate lyase-activating enzyme